MDYSDILRIAIQLILMLAGIMALMLVSAVIGFKVKAKGAWYCEFNDQGTVSTVLLKAGTDNTVDYMEGTYRLPTQPRMLTLWPPGVPVLVQEKVYHEKFVVGNENPMEMPELFNDQGSAAYTRQLNMAEGKALSQVQDSFGALTGGNNTLVVATLIIAGVAALGAAAAAYYGYTISEEKAAILGKVGGGESAL